MSSKLKVTLSLDQALLKDLAAVSRATRASRSHLVEEALRLWQQRRLEEELKAGYLAMADEDRKTAKAQFRAGSESMR